MSMQPGIPEGPPHDLVYGYVLDGLDAHDTEVFEAHLSSCDPCSAELLALGDTVTTMLANTGRLQPPAWVEEELMARVFGDSAPEPASAPAAEPTQLSTKRKSLRRVWLVPIAVAASVVLLLGLGIGMSSVINRSPSQVVAEDTSAQLLEVTSASDAHFMPMPLPVGTAKLVVSASMNEVAIMANNLPMPEKGQMYHVWTRMHDGTMVSSAVFAPNSHGHAATMLNTGVTGASGFVLTVQDSNDTEPSAEALAEVDL